MARKVAVRHTISEEVRIKMPRELLDIFDREPTVLIKKFPIGAPGFWPVDVMALGKLEQLLKGNKELQARFDVVLMPK